MNAMKSVVIGLLYLSASTFSAVAVESPCAQGGEVSQVGDDFVHVFTNSGTFKALMPLDAQVLVVGGGGAGGTTIGGGGGGGAVVETRLSIPAGTECTVTVGAGGELRCGTTLLNVPSGNWQAGGSGGDSSLSFDGVSVLARGGGGGGGWRDGTPAEQAGQDGGNGGGGSHGASGGNATVPNGAAGGSSSGSGTNYGGGGGGGASGAAGGNGNASVAGNGGAGVVSGITGDNLDYGSGGGGGAGNNVTIAGLAGGDGAGAGAARNGNVTGGDGLDGRGGGGGGGGYQPATAGGRGGSGCVIIRYLGIMGNEIVVAGEPARYGTVEPSYQLIQQPVDGQSYEFSCVTPTQAVNEAGTTRAVCCGWSLTKLADKSEIKSSSSPGESLLSCSHTYVQGEGVSLTWRWQVQHKVTAAAATAGGTVAPAEQWVADGAASEPITATASDASTTFFDWTGDVKSSDNPLVVRAVTAPVSVLASFSSRICVATTGDDATADGSEGKPFASFAAALAKAADNDVIEVAEGEYTLTAQVTVNKAVTVRGAGAGKTVLKRSASVQKMRILSVESAGAVVMGMTLDGGFLDAGNGAGAYVTAGTLQDCEIMNCSESHWGGVSGCGVYATGLDALVLGCDIHDNYATMGQGMGLGLADYAVARNCLVRDNRCIGANSHYAVFIYRYGTLENCTVTRNDCWNDAAVGTDTGNNNYMQVVANCVVWGNTGNTPLAASSSVIGEGWTIKGDLRRVTNTTLDDPDFIDYAGGNFRLDAASPCVTANQGCYPFDTTAVTCGVFTVTREVFPNQEVVFTAAAFNCSGDYVWDFGDGTDPVTTTEPTATHAYATYGTYDVSLSVGAASCLRSGYVRGCPRTMYADNNSPDPVPPYATPGTAATFIEDALDIAIDGSEIVVLAGTQQMRDAASIKIFKGVTVRGETGVKEDVTVEKKTGADQVFHLNHRQARVESLTADGKKTAHGSGQDKNGGCFWLEGLGGTVSNCVMRGIAYGNWGDHGGGVCMDTGLVTHCVISNNEIHISSGGSGVYMSGGTVENSLIAYNRVPTEDARYDGSTVRMGGDSRLVNCTVVGNVGYKRSGLLFADAKPQVVNCVIAENTSRNLEGLEPGVYNDATYASCFVACAAPFQINDTCFAGNLGFRNSSAGDFHLVVGSVCVDNGTLDGVNVPAVDLDGNDRLDDSGKIDIGCYELKVEGVQVSLAADVTTPTAGLAPHSVIYHATVAGADPLTLTYKWDVYGDGSKIVETDVPTLDFTYETNGTFNVKLTVEKGGIIYEAVNQLEASSYPPVHYVDRNNATPEAPYDSPAKAANDLATAVAAAYAGAEIVVAPGRYPLTAQVLVDKAVSVRGETGDPEDVVFYRSNKNVNHRIFALNNSKATIASLTAEGGNLWGNYSDGGNVHIGLSGGTVTNCVLRNGSVGGWDSYGGGLRIVANSPNALVTHCVITNNSVSTGGSAGDITGGGGAYISAGVLRNSLIAYNYQLSDNTCDANFGGGVTMDGGILESCTVVANRARICGGVNAKDGTVRNCVIAGNESTVSTDPARKVWSGKDTAFDHCLAPVKINDNCFVQVQPFASPATGDFTLAAGSDGIDAADPQDWMTGATDLAGNDRIRGDGPDIGAYEADANAFAASFEADVSEGFGPLPVTFTVTPVNAGAQGVSCAWVVDGGTPEVSTELTFEKTFAVGDHTVSLTVTDVESGAVFPVPGFVRIFSAPRTMYVAPADGSVTSVYPYATHETAATNVKHAVDAALPNTEIVLLCGLHKMREITYLNAPVTIRGETGRPEDVELRMGSSGAYRLFNLNSREAFVHGLTLSGFGSNNGYNFDAFCAYFEPGGGCVSNCVLRNGVSIHWGGSGAAAHLNSDNAILTHCIITNNQIGCSDGCEKGMAVVIERGRMENCLVAFNRTSNPSGTKSTSNGGAVYMTGGSMVNCTVVSNSYQGCAGVYATGGTVANSIVVGNKSTLVSGDEGEWRGNAECFARSLVDTAQKVNDTCLTGSTEVFRQARIKKGVFIPLGGSAARDAGDNAFVSEATDLYGKPRVFGGNVDLGCAESQAGGMTLLVK